jgi:hypothetical protein
LDGILFTHRVMDKESFCSWQIFKEFQQASYAEHVKGLVQRWES